MITLLLIGLLRCDFIFWVECPQPPLAQKPDTAITGIHRLEQEIHRWDVLRINTSVPALSRGKEFAVKKMWSAAEREFHSAVRFRPADAYFNLGLLFYHRDKLSRAAFYLKKASSVWNDSLTHFYLNEIRRRAPQK